MLSLAGNQARVICFSPKHWGEVGRFVNLCGSTHKFEDRVRSALGGIEGHFHKADVFIRLTLESRLKLQEDAEELKNKGHSTNQRGQETGALFETALCELYSSVDCARQILTAIFKNFQGVPDSTRKFFQNASDGKLDPRLPESIRKAFEEARWYTPLRKLRDAVVHSDVGLCQLCEDAGKMTYWNSSVKTDDGRLLIKDAEAELLSQRSSVNGFLGRVFRALNENLLDQETHQVCGFFDGRVYTRFVKPSEAIDFNSGRCDAMSWFENDADHRCPFADSCGAYKQAKDAVLS